MIIGNGTNHKTANITVYQSFQALLKHKTLLRYF